jgi:hypothetical protein
LERTPCDALYREIIPFTASIKQNFSHRNKQIVEEWTPQIADPKSDCRLRNSKSLLLFLFDSFQEPYELLNGVNVIHHNFGFFGFSSTSLNRYVLVGIAK